MFVAVVVVVVVVDEDGLVIPMCGEMEFDKAERARFGT